MGWIRGKLNVLILMLINKGRSHACPTVHLGTAIAASWVGKRSSQRAREWRSWLLVLY